MVCTVRAFLEFCYTARRAYLTDTHLDAMDDALKRFHQNRRIFLADEEDEDDEDPNLTLPRQHSMVHYRNMTESFGSAGGLCSSITESKHISAVKETWRRSNRNDPLAQMILANQRLSKLAELRRVLQENGLLEGNLFEHVLAEMEAAARHGARHESVALSDDHHEWAGILDSSDPMLADPTSDGEKTTSASSDEDSGLDDNQEDSSDRGSDENHSDDDQDGPIDDERTSSHVFMARRSRMYSCSVLLNSSCLSFSGRNYPRRLAQLQDHLELPLVHLCDEFLAQHLAQHMADKLPPPIETVGAANACVWVFDGAVALFHAPSDPSGIHGMKRERIHCTQQWRSRGPREDCMLVAVDPEDAMDGLQAARVKLFFSLEYEEEMFHCALVHWYDDYSEDLDSDTGMRVIVPSFLEDNRPHLDVISLDAIVRASHLLPIAGTTLVPSRLSYTDTLDSFRAFYLNSFIDHHMFDLLH
jgi:hypothetical protein